MNRSAAISNALMLPLLLGSSESLAGALGTLLMFATVVSLYGLCMPALRSRLTGTSVLLASLLLAATFTSCAELMAQRWFLPWQQAFGLYTSLFALQCVVLEHNGFWHQSLTERFKLCVMFGSLMLMLAGLRELIGHGSLGRGLAESWPGIVVFSEGLHLITLIPGAFILLALLLAARQALIRPELNFQGNTSSMNAAKRLEIFRRLHEDNPEPKTELAYSSPFELLIAVILSAQSTDVGVNKATAKLFPIANTPAAIHALGVDGLSEYIKTIGLYNSKARNVIETCRLLVERHGSEVPQTREELEALPGVGRKTANVVLNTAFRQLTMAVDTHIFRVSNRTGIAPGKNVVEVEKKLMKFVPKEFLLDSHHWLILHGRYVCLARKPRCGSCRIEDLCEYKDKTSDD